MATNGGQWRPMAANGGVHRRGDHLTSLHLRRGGKLIKRRPGSDDSSSLSALPCYGLEEVLFVKPVDDAIAAK